MSLQIKKAMVLAAGMGTRMRPLTDDRPKPLVEVAGRALIDHTLDRLAEAGVEEVVVNLHYMADMLEAHLSRRQDLRVVFSDERDLLLDTGGGVRKALSHFGDGPFFVVNSDALWLDPPGGPRVLTEMTAAYEETDADYLMLVTPKEMAVGYTGLGDFKSDALGHLSWREEGGEAPLMFAGVQIMSAGLFGDAPGEAFSNKWVWNEVLIPSGRFVGHMMKGEWLHASSAEDVAEIERVLKERS